MTDVCGDTCIPAGSADGYVYCGKCGQRLGTVEVFQRVLRLAALEAEVANRAERVTPDSVDQARC